MIDSETISSNMSQNSLFSKVKYPYFKRHVDKELLTNEETQKTLSSILKKKKFKIIKEKVKKVISLKLNRLS